MFPVTRKHDDPRRAIRPQVAVAALVLLLAACSGAATGSSQTGGGPPAASAGAAAGAATGGTPAARTGATAGGAAKPDPCTLLTADELKGQLGADFMAGKLDPNTDLSGPGAPECHWNPQKVTAYDIVTLSIETLDESAKSQFDYGRGQTGARPASGVGDDAYLGVIGSLSFTKGPWLLVLVIGVGSQRQTTDQQMIALAKLAVSRL